MTVELAVAGVAAGGLVQSATGFGFALVAAPALTAALGPLEAVPTIALLSLVVNALTLAAEGRRPVVLRRTAGWIVAASVPGTVAGALVLARAPQDVLRLTVAAVVIGSVVVYVRTRGPDRPRRSSATGTGLLAGALGATSGVNGPPLVLHLRRIGATASQSRDTLAVIFLSTGVITLAAFAATGALRIAPAILAMAIAAAAGQAIGARLFGRLSAHREAATLGVLALSVAAATVPAVQALS